jgi:hypothetical protein
MAAVTWTLTCPTQLDVTSGAHPTAVYRAISGVTRTRVFGSLPVSPTIRARFFATTAEAADAFSKYHTSLSGADPVIIDQSLFTGHEALWDALPKTGITWHFSREPEASPQFRGRVELSVEFEGRIEV